MAKSWQFEIKILKRLNITGVKPVGSNLFYIKNVIVITRLRIVAKS